MNRKKKTTEWPDGFEADIRVREFTDIGVRHHRRPTSGCLFRIQLIPAHSASTRWA